MKRRRLQLCFEKANQQSASGNFDYATDMFVACVTGDPGNKIYAQNFLGNLQKKYNNNKKGSKLAGIKGATTKGALKKASLQKDWKTAIAAGLELLKLNPWDTWTLSTLAAACEALGHDESQLVYLKTALDVNIKDPDINRQCGLALGRMRQFDQAIICWHRVEQARPGNDEAAHAISDLIVNKTISDGGYENAESSTDVMTDKEEQAARLRRTSGEPQEMSPEKKLEREIAARPNELPKYLELADLHDRNERFVEAVDVLSRALKAFPDEVSVRERMEDIQVRGIRQRLAVAKHEAEAKKTPEATAEYNRVKGELNQIELDVYRSRCERYPANLGLHYEYGVRLQRAGNFNEAIKQLQAARGDVKRKGLVFIVLGECFQQIEQYRLALTNYELAVEATQERYEDQRKLALYRAGCLAMAIKDWEKAEKYLSDLAGLDFGYKDVADRLDKIAKLRHKE
ncbi:MAG: tetratricopeptide repeat protein [Pirellulales bacterium]